MSSGHACPCSLRGRCYVPTVHGDHLNSLGFRRFRPTSSPLVYILPPFASSTSSDLGIGWLGRSQRPVELKQEKSTFDGLGENVSNQHVGIMLWSRCTAETPTQVRMRSTAENLEFTYRFGIGCGEAAHDAHSLTRGYEMNSRSCLESAN